MAAVFVRVFQRFFFSLLVVVFVGTFTGCYLPAGSSALLGEESVASRSEADDPDDPDSGTEDNPHVVGSAEQLVELLQSDDLSLDAHYVLNADIDLSDHDDWKPIGSAAEPFTGSFDGGGHVIHDLEFESTDHDEMGFFGVVAAGAVIQYVGIEDADLEDNTHRNHRGLLAGINYGTIRYSFATGSVEGNYAIGGLVGINEGTIEKSYALVEVYGNSAVGGLVGVNRGSGRITVSYAAEEVETWNEGENEGALVGSNEWHHGEQPEVTKSFFDQEINPGMVGVRGDDGNVEVTGLTTDEATSPEIFIEGGLLEDYGFDFENTWDIDSNWNEGYPFLRAVPPE